MSDILITSEYFGKFSPEARELLCKAGHHVIDNPYGHKALTPEEILPYAAKADAMICDLENINKDVIDAAKKLKIISRRGVGVDSVDVAYAAEKNITIARTLGVVEPPVAELVMAYILDFSRRVGVLNAHMHDGRWERCECHSVFGKTLGIVGMRKIAYETARRACAFGMNVLYYDAVSNEKAEKAFGAQRKSLDEVLAKADFVTVHLPLTEQTRGFFDYPTICKMKKSAYLINTERDASKLHWETLPDGDHGIKVPREVSDVSEEHSFVTLSDGSIFCVFRTVSGNSYCAYSRDKGHTFTAPEKMTYADGRPMRHPRAANFIWKCQNGKYLYWYHNHGGKTYDDRNPVWLSGAVEYAAADGMRLKFSQPEILLYDPDVMIRMSYPDMIEEGGAYYFTETQKCLARTHKAETSLIEGLWSQFDKEGERKHGIVLQNGSAMPELRPFIERDYTANDSHSVDTGASFSLLLTADFDKPGVLFSTMTQEHRGMEAAFDGEKIVFTLGDGRRTNVFYSDKAPLAAKGVHTVVVQVDAGSRVVSMMIDRKVCDGADERQFGYGWFDRSLLHANGNQTAFVGEQVCLAELFPNGLTNSEAFWL